MFGNKDKNNYFNSFAIESFCLKYIKKIKKLMLESYFNNFYYVA